MNDKKDDQNDDGSHRKWFEGENFLVFIGGVLLLLGFTGGSISIAGTVDANNLRMNDSFRYGAIIIGLALIAIWFVLHSRDKAKPISRYFWLTATLLGIISFAAILWIVVGNRSPASATAAMGATEPNQPTMAPSITPMPDPPLSTQTPYPTLLPTTLMATVPPQSITTQPTITSQQSTTMPPSPLPVTCIPPQELARQKGWVDKGWTGDKWGGLYVELPAEDELPPMWEALGQGRAIYQTDSDRHLSSGRWAIFTPYTCRDQFGFSH